MNADSGHPPPGTTSKWRDLLTAASLGGLLTDAAVNVFSSDFGHRGLTVAAITFAVLGGANRIHGLPARSALGRYSPYVLLGLATAAAALSLVTPRSWSGWTTMVAAVLVVGAVLIPSDLVTVVHLLLRAAVVGYAMVWIGRGIALHADPVAAQLAVVTGLCWLGIAANTSSRKLGASLRRIARGLRRRQPQSIALVAGALAGGVLVVGGISTWHGGEPLTGATYLGIGTMSFGAGVAVLHEAGILRWARTWLVSLTLEPPSPASGDEPDQP